MLVRTRLCVDGGERLQERGPARTTGKRPQERGPAWMEGERPQKRGFAQMMGKRPRERNPVQRITGFGRLFSFSRRDRHRFPRSCTSTHSSRRPKVLLFCTKVDEVQNNSTYGRFLEREGSQSLPHFVVRVFGAVRIPAGVVATWPKTKTPHCWGVDQSWRRGRDSNPGYRVDR